MVGRRRGPASILGASDSREGNIMEGRVYLVLSAFAVLFASGCGPVEMARFNCNQGNQSACIDYQEYTRRGAPGTVSAKAADAPVPQPAPSAQSTASTQAP